MLSQAGGRGSVEGAQRCHGSAQATGIVPRRAPGLERLSVGKERFRRCEIAEPADMVGIEVIGLIIPIGSRLPEGCNGGHYQPLVNCLEAFIVQPYPLHRQGRVVFYKDVRLLH